MTDKRKKSKVPKMSEARSVADLVKVASLTSIDTVDLIAHRAHDRWVGGGVPLPTEFRVDTSLVVHSPNTSPIDKTSYLVVVGCKWLERGAAEPYGIVEVAIRVAYHFAGLSKAPEIGLLSQFGTEIAVHHAWPFLRERIRSASMEIGLQPAVLPIRHATANMFQSPPAGSLRTAKSSSS